MEIVHKTLDVLLATHPFYTFPRLDDAHSIDMIHSMLLQDQMEVSDMAFICQVSRLIP